VEIAGKSIQGLSPPSEAGPVFFFASTAPSKGTEKSYANPLPVVGRSSPFGRFPASPALYLTFLFETPRRKNEFQCPAIRIENAIWLKLTWLLCLWIISYVCLPGSLLADFIPVLTTSVQLRLPRHHTAHIRRRSPILRNDLRPMTSNYSSMDYGFVSSPSQSPSLLYPNGQYFDSTSESSNPSSPDQMNQMMFNTIPMQYDMLQYDPSGNGLYPIGKIPVEYTGSSTLDESDRRRRRTGSTTSSKDKDAIPNMHLVCLFSTHWPLQH
jgi:hypothetical protein